MNDVIEEGPPQREEIDQAGGSTQPMDGREAYEAMRERATSADMISQMRELLESLKPAEARVAQAILSDPEFALHASTAILADRAEVSEPTVTRFCRTLGCAGVRDFKLRLAQSLVVGAIYFSDRTSNAREESPLPFRSAVFQRARQAIDLVEAQLDDTKVVAAIDLIAGARRVLVFGVGGGSTSLAQETQFRLFRYGINVTSYLDPYLIRMVVSTVGPEDAVLLISATGRTEEIIEAAEIARQYHARTVAITREGSQLAQVVDVPLTANIPEDADVMKPTASRYAFLSTMDLLATGVGYKLGLSAQETLRRVKFNLMNIREGEVLEPLGD